MAPTELHRSSWQTQLIRFAAVGAVGTGAHYLLLVMLVEAGGVNEVAASTAGATLGALVNYVLNRHYTFRSTRRHVEALPRFLAIAGLGLVINFGLMLVMIEGLRIHYLVAQVVATALVLLWNFAGNRLITFSQRH